MVTLGSRSTTPASRLALLACLALILTPMLGGCSHYIPAAAAIQDSWDCSLAAPSGGTPSSTLTPEVKGSVPEGFIPVSAVLCSWEVAFEATHGEMSGDPMHAAIREDRLGGDYTDLLAALAQPSDKGGSGQCTADMEILPHLWLVDAAGRAVNAQWPVDSCGKTRGKPDTARALDALQVVESKIVRVPWEEQ